jgi:hypothetical protein
VIFLEAQDYLEYDGTYDIQITRQIKRLNRFTLKGTLQFFLDTFTDIVLLNIRDHGQ